MRRGEVFVSLLIVLFGAAIFVGDRYLPAAGRTAPEDEGGRFLSTAWYCPLPGGEGVGSSVSTTNLGDEPVKLRRWTAGEEKASSIQESDLPGRRRTAFAAADFGIPNAAGVVEAFGARTLSDFTALGPRVGVGSTRCSVQPFDVWMFGVASTLRRTDTHLLVANPFREEARIKVRVITSSEDVSPSSLDGIVIPPLSQARLFLGDYYRETEMFGLEVVASAGRILVARSLQWATRDGVRGLSVDLGVGGPSENWQFAGGEVPTDGEETLSLVNPGESEALVQVTFQTETEQLTQPALQEIPIPAGRQVVIKMSEHLPRGTRHGTTISSINAVPVVAEVLSVGSLAGVKGMDAILGQLPVDSSRWIVPTGSPAGGSELLAITNTSDQQATVSVILLTEQSEVRPPELSAIPVGGGRRATVDITQYLAGGAASALVESSTPGVFVARRLVLGDPYNDFADTSGRPF